MRGQRKNPRKAVQPFENKKRKIDIFKNYEANGVEKIQRKLEIFSTLISKKSTFTVDWNIKTSIFKISFQKDVKSITRENAEAVLDHERQEARELYRFLNV